MKILPGKSILIGLLVAAIMATPLLAKDPPPKPSVPAKDPAAAKNTAPGKDQSISKTSVPTKKTVQSDPYLDNKKLVTDALNLLYKGDTPAFTMKISADFVDHNGMGDSVGNIGGLISFSNAIRSALSEVKFQIDDVQAGENIVFVIGKITGSYTGPFQTNLPHGNRVNIPTAELFKLEGQSIKERWGVRDLSALNANTMTTGTMIPQAVNYPITNTLSSDIIDSTRSKDTKPADGVLKGKKGKASSNSKHP